MLSLRQPARHPLPRSVARTLIAALLVSLVSPLRAEASISPARLTYAGPFEHLAPASPPASPKEVLVCVVTVVADPSGLTKSAFGELLAHTGSDPQPYAFTGEPYDPNSGFQYHRARWMDPKSGRFAGMDSFAGRHEDPASLHKYLYAAGGPVDRVDPTGQDWNLPSLATVNASISTLAVIYVPRLTSIFLTVAQTLAPAELGVLPKQIGLFQLRGAVASAGPIVVHELGGIRRALTALGGRATGPLGIAFETWIGRFLRPGVRTQVAVREGFELGSGPGSGSRAGAAILDYVDDAVDVIYEVKASFSAVKYNQAFQTAQYAVRSGKRVVYVFLRKPNQAQLNQLAEWIGDGAKEVGGAAEFGVNSVF